MKKETKSGGSLVFKVPLVSENKRLFIFGVFFGFVSLLLSPLFDYFRPHVAFAGETPTASEIVRNVQKNYDETNDAVIHFTQTVVLPISKLSKTTKGVLYFKKGNKYKIESGDNVIVTDGKTIWTYNPTSGQVIVDNYRDDKNTIDPNKFLFNIPSDYYVVLLNAKRTDRDTAYTLRLTPKSDGSFIRSITIVVAGNWAVRSAEVHDINDNKYTYTVNDLKVNSGLPDSEFEFVPPKGARIVDLRQR
jgi:outer membrane lipoprotein carrier protein